MINVVPENKKKTTFITEKNNRDLKTDSFDHPPTPWQTPQNTEF